MNETIHDTETTGSTVVATRTGPEWASIIRDDLSRAVEGIITAGQHLTQAKNGMNHGEWIPMLNGIGISRQHAHKLMRIGANPALSNPNHGSDLPRSIKALHELSQLDPDEIEHGVEGGTIHPDMTIKDAKDLAGKPGTSAFDKAMKGLKAFMKNAPDTKGDELRQLFRLVDDLPRQLDMATGGRP